MSKKIQATKNYAMFHKSEGNRPLDLRKHKKLVESMRLYGFLKCYPIVAYRDADGHLAIKDGQHRFAVAESLGLTVYWVEEDVDFDVALVNNTQKVWVLRDYALKHAANGLRQYQEGIDFAEQHKIPLGTAFSLLAGTTSFSNCESTFVDGTFKIKDRTWANMVASIYGSLTAMAPEIKKVTFIDACMCVCRVEGFDPKRLIAGASRCREKLVNYGTRDAFLTMLEEVYNFGRLGKNLVPLKIQATAAMRDRNAFYKKAMKKTDPPAAA